MPRMAHVLTSVPVLPQRARDGVALEPGDTGPQGQLGGGRQLGVQAADVAHDFERIVTSCASGEMLARACARRARLEP